MPYFDVADPAFRVTSAEVRRAREAGWYARTSYGLAVLRYDDCARVLRDDTTFSSRVYERVMGPVMGHTILEMDAPDHSRFRGLAGHAFRILGEALDELAHVLMPALVGRVVAQVRDRGLEIIGDDQAEQVTPAAPDRPVADAGGLTPQIGEELGSRLRQ